MFGYVRPYEPELKVRELALYKAFYCGLCDVLSKKYGLAARAALSYDATFLAIVLSGLYGAPTCRAGRCSLQPLTKKRPKVEDSRALRLSADIAVLMSYYKLADDKADDRRAVAAAGKLALAQAHKRAAREQPKAEMAIKRGLDELAALERSNSKDIDAAAAAFGKMLRDTLSCAEGLDSGASQPLMSMGYNLGVWIYLIDAWDDRERDRKRGSYNPFNAAEADAERAKFVLGYPLTMAQNASDLMELGECAPLVENILSLGCPRKTAELFGDIDQMGEKL